MKKKIRKGGREEGVITGDERRSKRTIKSKGEAF